MRVSVTALMMGMGLAGCGDSAGNDAGPDAATTPASTPEVTVDVTGAYSGTFESTGAIFCSTDALSGTEGFELYAMKSPEQFNLRMPRRAAPGTYSVSSGSGSSIDFYYTDPQRVKYDRIESATLRLEAVPQAPGERLIGSISATLQNRDGPAVDVQVRLDLDAGAQSFNECK